MSVVSRRVPPYNMNEQPDPNLDKQEINYLVSKMNDLMRLRRQLACLDVYQAYKENLTQLRCISLLIELETVSDKIKDLASRKCNAIFKELVKKKESTFSGLELSPLLHAGHQDDFVAAFQRLKKLYVILEKNPHYMNYHATKVLIRYELQFYDHKKLRRHPGLKRGGQEILKKMIRS